MLLKNKPDRKIRIVMTGGHLTPAIAVIEQLKKDPNWEIFFIGRKYTQHTSRLVSHEVRQIPELGVQFVTIPAGKLPRYFSLGALLSLLYIPAGFIWAYYYLKKFKPDIILLFGGYLAVPVAISGRLLKIPVVTHEQTAVKGLANELIEKIADRVAVSWKNGATPINKKAVLTGNPVREVIIKGPGIRVNVSQENLPLIYVTGGNQGSTILNQIIADTIRTLTEKYIVVHQCGMGKGVYDYEILQTIRTALTEKKKQRYLVQQWFSDLEVAWLLRNSELVISRSGANIITELALLGCKSLLVPLPKSARDEQLQNALLLKESGIAEILDEAKLTRDTFLKAIEQMLTDKAKYEQNKLHARSKVRADAAKKIIRLIRSIYNEKI